MFLKIQDVYELWFYNYTLGIISKKYSVYRGAINNSVIVTLCTCHEEQKMKKKPLISINKELLKETVWINYITKKPLKRKKTICVQIWEKYTIHCQNENYM